MNEEVSDRTRRIVGFVTLVLAVLIIAFVIFLLRPRSGNTLEIPVQTLNPGSVVYYSNRGLFVVREGDEIIALSDQEPNSGCRVTWRPDLTLNGMNGAFQSPCSGRTYDRRGRPHTSGEPLQPLRVERMNEQVIVHPDRSDGG
jgi:Rieske Fe-S protein